MDNSCDNKEAKKLSRQLCVPDDAAAKQNGLVECFLGLLREKTYGIVLALTLAFCYGYRCVSFVPGIDDLATDYYRGIGLLAQGRFTSVLLTSLLGFFSENPYAETFLGVLLFGAAAVVICAFLRSVNQAIVTVGFCTVFTCLFLSCALIPESFCFFGMPLAIAVNFIGTTAAVYFARKAIRGKKRLALLPAVVLLVLVVSLYEAFVVYYVSLVFAVFILEYLAAYRGPRLRFKTVLFDGLKYLAVLVAAVLVEYLVSALLIKLAGITETNYSDYALTPRYFSQGFFGTLIITIKELVVYHLSGFWNFPVAVLNLSILLLLIFAVVSLIKTKNGVLPLLFAGLIFSLFLMSLITGEVAKPRGLQCAYFVDAFAFALLFAAVAKTNRKKLIAAVSACFVLLVVWQGGYINKLFYVENNKRTAELTVLSQVYWQAAQTADVTAKPLIVVGDYSLNERQKEQCYITTDAYGYRVLNRLLSGRLDAIFRPDQGRFVTPLTALSSRSTVKWVINGLRGSNTELYAFFDYLGFVYVPCTSEQYERACLLAQDMPEWGQQGCIKETGEFIIVKMFNSDAE